MRTLLARLVALTATALVLLTTQALAQEDRADWLDIEVGKSVVLETPRVPKAIAITNPEVANAVPLGVANKLQIQGAAIGTTDLVVQFGPTVPPMIYEITVHRDMSDLIRRIDAIVEGEPPRVYPLGERIVVEGPVDDLDTLEQVALVARIYDEEFVNLMAVRGDHQVQLEVLFAEVSRSAVRELGLNVLFNSNDVSAVLKSPAANYSTHVAVPQAAALIDPASAGGLVPSATSSGFSLGAYLPLQGTGQMGAVMGIMDEYKLGKILAQPTLVSLSGQEAKFLAGGELPIPVPSGTGAASSITIEFKEYGIKLVFVPTVLAGDVVDVRMEIEVSEPDYSNTTRIAGLDVPGFITRKGHSHLRVESGMTFAVAGMLSDNTNYIRVGLPGLGRLPIIGALFRSVRHVRDETEVVLYVTPRLVRPLAPGEVPAAPGTTENNNPSDVELFLIGMDHRPGSRTASPTGAVGLQR